MVLIFSGLTHYIYCSTLISTIFLRVLIILLFTVVIIINFVLLLLLLPLPFRFIYLFHLRLRYLYIYLLIRGPIRPEESPFCRFFKAGMLGVERVG